MNAMFALGQRLLDTTNPSIDFFNYSNRSGMYVKLTPIRGKEKRAVTDLILKHIPCPVRPSAYLDDSHITVIWSKYAVPKGEILGVSETVLGRYFAILTSVAYWPGHDNVGYIVFNVKSDELVNLHEMLVKLGAQHSFSTYEPHMTIAAKVGPLTEELRNWMSKVNVRLAQKELTLMLSSITFSDLWE